MLQPCITLLSFIGNVYVTDTGNQRIRKVTVSTGVITTIAGTGVQSYSGDNGEATSASFYDPYGIVVDASGICYTSMLVYQYSKYLFLLPLSPR